MDGIKGFFVGLGLLCGLSILAIQLYVAMTAIHIAREVDRPMVEAQALERSLDSYGGGREIAGSGESGSRKPGFEALVNFDKMSDNRAVQVSTVVRLGDLLDKGEMLPDKELLPAFVTARATRVADAECALIKMQVASECQIGGASGSLGRNNTATLNFTLNFIQKEPFGTIKEAKKLGYVEVTQDLIEGKITAPEALDSAARFRASLYGRAAKFCARMQSSLGNCAISRIWISADANRADASVQVSMIEPLR